MAELNPATLTIFSVVLGLLIGSFLNVVIHRLPLMMEREWKMQCAELSGTTPAQEEPFSLIAPRSRCPHCGHRIGALENIPILSYLLQKGCCKGCGKGISLRYPLVEALTALVFGYAAWRFGFSLAGAGAMLFLAIMIALTFIDADTQLLPDDLTLPLLWAGLLINLFNTFTSLPNAVVGAAVGYLALWSVYWLFKLATGKEGMGYGDFKLLAAIGAWLGWPLLPLVILLSSLVGAVIGIALIVLAKRGRNVPMPFGPYLAIAGVIALFWGNEINRTYLGLF